MAKCFNHLNHRTKMVRLIAESRRLSPLSIEHMETPLCHWEHLFALAATTNPLGLSIPPNGHFEICPIKALKH